MRSRTRYRIALAIAVAGTLAWVVVCSIPPYPLVEAWPWPPGFAATEQWTAVYKSEDPQPVHILSSRTHELKHYGGTVKSSVDKDGYLVPSDLEVLNDQERLFARMIRLLVFIVGCVLGAAAIWLMAMLSLVKSSRATVQILGSQYVHRR